MIDVEFYAVSIFLTISHFSSQFQWLTRWALAYQNEGPYVVQISVRTNDSFHLLRTF